MRTVPQIDIAATYAGVVPHTPSNVYTALFREDSGLQFAASAAVDHYIRDERRSPFTALSIGCSVGAEVDSELVYLQRYAPALGSITMFGLDANPVALKQAKTGQYYATASIVGSTANQRGVFDTDLRAQLPEFDITILGNSDASRSNRLSATHAITTERLRQKHDVSFILGDVTKPEQKVLAADLILCNWVLFHISTGRLPRVIDNLAKWLKPGGVLSLDSYQEPRSRNEYVNSLLLAQAICPIQSDFDGPTRLMPRIYIKRN